MRISGITIIRNGVNFGYPFIESIRSALPICDEYVVVVGDCKDGTLEAVRSMNDPKIRIVETVWSDKVKPGMCVLAQQTNIGLHMCTGDWALYLQANEVLHENSLEALRNTMAKHVDDPSVEALLLERLTFWGDYENVIPVYPHRFKFSPRIVRPYIGTYSIRDAMSFAVFDRFSLRGRYPAAVDTGENVYRYGNVMSAAMMQEKIRKVVHLHREEESFDEAAFYNSFPRSFVSRFKGTHPAVMGELVRSFKHKLSVDDPRWREKLTLKEWQRLCETRFYEKFGIMRFRNTRYRLVGDYVHKQQPY